MCSGIVGTLSILKQSVNWSILFPFAQVNFMSAQLLATQAIAESAERNEMQRLDDAQAEENLVAAEDKTNERAPATSKGVLFVRGENKRNLLKTKQ